MTPLEQPAENAPDDNETAAERRRRPGRREWLGQVDFWEGVKEFILRRSPPGSREVDQLY